MSGWTDLLQDFALLVLAIGLILVSRAVARLGAARDIRIVLDRGHKPSRPGGDTPPDMAPAAPPFSPEHAARMAGTPHPGDLPSERRP